MFEVETIHLLGQEPQGFKRSKHSLQKKLMRLVLVVLLISTIGIAYRYFNNKVRFNIPTVPVFFGEPRSATEIIHAAHYLSVQLPSSTSANRPQNFFSQFVRAYKSMRSNKMNEKDRENLLAIEDLVNVFEQREALREGDTAPGVFWEKVMPMFGLKPDMMNNPLSSNVKPFAGNLAHSKPLRSPVKEKDDLVKDNYPQNRLLTPSTAAIVQEDIVTMIQSIEATEFSLERVAKLMEKVAQTEPETLEQVTLLATSTKEATIAVFLTIVSKTLKTNTDSEAILFLTAFELSRLSSTLNSQSQLLCRVIESIAQNWSKYRYLSRSKVDKGLSSVYASNNRDKSHSRADIYRTPLVMEDESEGVWTQLSQQTWK
jgi:hypothetical protein